VVARAVGAVSSAEMVGMVSEVAVVPEVAVPQVVVAATAVDVPMVPLIQV